jgi:hypothetical protein
MDFNLYTIFRLMITAVTLYNLVDGIQTILRYKPYYDRLPTFLKRFLFQTLQQQWQQQLQQPDTPAQAFVYRKIREHRRDLLINGMLLFVLISLNIILFFI